MANFKVELKNWEEVKNSLSQGEFTKKIILALGQVVENVHSELSFAVTRTYATPKELKTARVNKRQINNSTQNNINTIINGLEYKGEELRLYQFPFKVNEVDPNGAKFFAPNPYWEAAEKGSYKRKTELEQISVKIKREGGFKTLTDAFRWRSKLSSGPMQILRRDTAKPTWKVRPSMEVEGIRNPYWQLHGPSLPGMANECWEKDEKVKALVEKIPEIVANLIGKN